MMNLQIPISKLQQLSTYMWPFLFHTCFSSCLFLEVNLSDHIIFIYEDI